MEGGTTEVDGNDHQIGRYNAEESFEIKFPKIYAFARCYLLEELPGNQVAAQYKEEVDACPSETPGPVDPLGMLKDPVVVNEHQRNGQCPKMI